MDKSRNFILFGFLALIVSLVAASLAYVSYKHSIEVEESSLNDVKWDVHFTNLECSDKTDNVVENIAPTINDGTIINDYSITFTDINDYIEYTFDVVNNGTFNAKLVDIKLNNPKCSSMTNCDVSYELYEDDIKLENEIESIIEARTGKKSYKLVLKNNNKDLVEVNNLGVSFTYIQDGNYVTKNN